MLMNQQIRTVEVEKGSYDAFLNNCHVVAAKYLYEEDYIVDFFLLFELDYIGRSMMWELMSYTSYTEV